VQNNNPTTSDKVFKLNIFLLISLMLGNKRGLSNAVTVVLIILLVIIAFGIIWLSISRTLKSTEGGIDASQFTVKMEIIDNYVKVNEVSRAISVNIRRNPGEGDVIGVKLVLEDDSGQTFAHFTRRAIGEFETKIITFQYPTTFGSPKKISIYPVFLRTDGKESTGRAVDEYTIKGDESRDIPESCGNGLCVEGEECSQDCNTEKYCADGKDNDEEGGTDCEDQDCNNIAGCEYRVERTCNDGKDNDADGYVDCADSDCNDNAACTEICTDNIDNNNNNLVDCSEEICQQIEATCKEVRVFVSSIRYRGNLGGLNGADEKCQTLGNKIEQGKIWKAWLSDSRTSASSRLVQSRNKYKLVNGVVVANNWTDLIDGSILVPINVTEENNQITSATRVYTQTNAAGDISPNGAGCSDWTSDSSGANARTGETLSLDIDQKWTDKALTNCDSSIRIYCFEQPQ